MKVEASLVKENICQFKTFICKEGKKKDGKEVGSVLLQKEPSGVCREIQTATETKLSVIRVVCIW